MGNAKLPAPEWVTAHPMDNGIRVEYQAVKGAFGYFLRFYNADEPDKCIRQRYAPSCRKSFLGYTNGTRYLVEVAGYRILPDGSQEIGDFSEKVEFVPISDTLKAQNVICLSTEEQKQLKWEYKNTIPVAVFSSSDDEVAKVSADGMITAVSSGNADISVSAEGEQFTTKVYVDRERSMPVKNAVILLTGDLMCALMHQRRAVDYQMDFTHSFDDVRDIFRKADLSIGVLETTCFDGSEYEHEKLRSTTGAPNCNSPSTFLSAISDSGFDMLITADNHCRDSGYKGLEYTVSEMKRRGLTNLGTMGDNPVIRIINGIRIGFVACSMISNTTEDTDHRLDDSEVTGRYSREYISEKIRLARSAGAEFLIICQHWGRMNSSVIADSQRLEAKFIAELGADLIVGSHPHMLQKAEYINTTDGRKVLCAYSLGNFLTSQSEFVENREAAILRVELSRKEGRISSAYSYIPSVTLNTENGFEIRNITVPFSEKTRAAHERITALIGNELSPCKRRPHILLNGSIMLKNVFAGTDSFSVNENALFVSPLTACSGEGIPAVTEKGCVKMDLEKSFTEHLRNTPCDHLVIDMYAAAGISVYRLGNAVYTGSKAFLCSEFYKQHKNEMERIRPPFDENFWKPRLKEYAKSVMSAIPSEQIILFRTHFNDMMIKGGSELRNISRSRSVNKQMREMEDYFIRLVSPAVIDLSRYYFCAGDNPGSLEPEYFTDAHNAVQLISAFGRRCIYKPDQQLWLDRVLKYYDNMTARAYQSWLLDMNNAADLIISGTNKEFVARHRERLLFLKSRTNAGLCDVKHIFRKDKGAEDIISAAELIDSINKGELNRPYSFFAPAFRNSFNILKQMAKLLSNELCTAVSPNTAEKFFLLRTRPELLKSYLDKQCGLLVDIWGSCISRETLNNCSSAGVNKYIFKQCPLLAFEKSIPVEVPVSADRFCNNAWRRRTIAGAFDHSALPELEQSKAEWLVIDFYDIICKMAEIKGGLFEVDDFVMRTDFYKQIKKDCTPCYLFEKRSMEYCTNALGTLCKELKRLYGSNIILIRADLKDHYITLDDRIAKLSDNPCFEQKKELITSCEEQFIQLTDCFVIDISKYFYADDSFPLGGAHIVHYEAEFYKQAGAYIDEILKTGKRKLYDSVDDEYILLRELRTGRDE